MRTLLVSTYELGHQPLHLASPAAALLAAGHDVRCVDVAVEALESETVEWAEGIAVSVPMHTALRLAVPVLERIRQARPAVALCLYGLYAGVETTALPGPSPARLVGQYEPLLVAWAAEAEDAACGVPAPTVRVALGRHPFGLPARHLLPPLERYAQLIAGDRRALVGYVEASQGCKHRCRHCPVPVVYDGRTRLVGTDVVLADVAQLVAQGARHLTLGDPDFLNGPQHARRVVEAVHGAFPDLTFDLTAKVEHILGQRALWPSFAEAGCIFVVSAFESASDDVLRRLDKGHSVADELEAVAVLRSAGIEPRPSLLPFTPWTTTDQLLELFDLLAVADLIGNVDLVQLSIRLLVPPGSLLVSSGQLDGLLGDYDTERLGWTWRHHDPQLEALQAALADLAERFEGADPAAGYEVARALVGEATGDRSAAPAALAHLRSPSDPASRPRLSEPWFCCAEPTGEQVLGAAG
jgi:radical SAM superfamily enzyme YgiQ (UPF0313 family)